VIEEMLAKRTVVLVYLLTPLIVAARELEELLGSGNLLFCNPRYHKEVLNPNYHYER